MIDHQLSACPPPPPSLSLCLCLSLSVSVSLSLSLSGLTYRHSCLNRYPLYLFAHVPYLSLCLGCNKVHLASQSLPPFLHPQPAHNYYSNARGNSSVTQCACVYRRERLEPAISKIGGRRTKLLMIFLSLSLPRHLPCVLDFLMRYESLYTHAHEYVCQASYAHDLVIINTCFSDNLH